MGGEGSFYSLGGVPGQWRIPPQEASHDSKQLPVVDIVVAFRRAKRLG